MATKSLKAYSEENSLPIIYAYDEEINAGRKLITGFASIDDVQKCIKSVGGYPCFFGMETPKGGRPGDKHFLGELKQDELENIDINQVGVFKLSRFDRLEHRICLRGDTCARCQHCREYDPHEKTNRCDVSKRHGSILRGHYCENFKHRNGSGLFYRDGVPVRSKTSDDYRTELQWEKVGRKIKEGEKGLLMHPSMNTLKKYVYYLIEQTEECLD